MNIVESAYHVWEFFDDDVWGAETNVKNMGRHEDLFGEYEQGNHRYCSDMELKNEKTALTLTQRKLLW